MKGLVIALQKKIAELEKENEGLKERLDGEVGYFYEAMDYNTLAELANRQEKRLLEVEKENERFKTYLAIKKTAITTTTRNAIVISIEEKENE